LIENEFDPGVEIHPQLSKLSQRSQCRFLLWTGLLGGR
jgi:hypothetical protein